MARWKILAPALVAALASCSAAVLAVPGEAGAAFSGQNGRIAFHKYDGTHDDEIYTVSPNGSGLKQLTDSPRQDYSPAWSPDGSKIVYSKYRNPDTELFILDTQTGRSTRLTYNDIPDNDPAFSPDGSKVAFVSFRGTQDGSNADIFVMDASGGGVKRLTDTPGVREESPAWSPDGSKIAFEGKSDNIWVMDASDGSGQTNLTPGSARSGDGEPSWSPDGSRVAFDGYDGDGDIFTVKADGSGKTNVTDTSLAYEAQPAWAPNGKRLAFVTNDEGNNDVWTIKADGTDRRVVTDTPRVSEYYPDWGPKPATTP